MPAVEGFGDLLEIGRGGFSVVYSATQVGLGRRVVLKVVNAAGPEARRFEREALALGTLSDIANIVPVYQVAFAQDGRPAIVMPLLRDSLAQVIRRDGPAEPERVCRWLSQLAAALDAAHARGVVHRDVKPENVLLSSSDDGYLADFGIATLDSMTAGTETVWSLSPAHAPPERFAGVVTEAGESGDIYSLASTIYTALAGAAPHGTTAEGGVIGLATRVADHPVPRVEGLNEGANAVLAKGLAKQPADRWPTAMEFAAALQLQLAPRYLLQAPDEEDETIVVSRLASMTSPDSAARIAGIGEAEGQRDLAATIRRDASDDLGVSGDRAARPLREEDVLVSSSIDSTIMEFASRSAGHQSRLLVELLESGIPYELDEQRNLTIDDGHRLLAAEVFEALEYDSDEVLDSRALGTALNAIDASLRNGAFPTRERALKRLFNSCERIANGARPEWISAESWIPFAEACLDVSFLLTSNNSNMDDLAAAAWRLRLTVSRLNSK